MRSIAMQSMMLGGLLSLAWPAAGCGGAASPPAVQATPRQPVTLRERARIELGCAHAQLVELGERHVAVTGCGAQREYRRVCATSGCDWIAIDDLAIRAAFELECPAGQLEVVTLGATSRGVIGCGTRATYVLMCQHQSCHWLPSTVQRGAPGTNLGPAAMLE